MRGGGEDKRKEESKKCIELREGVLSGYWMRSCSGHAASEETEGCNACIPWYIAFSRGITSDP